MQTQGEQDKKSYMELIENILLKSDQLSLLLKQNVDFTKKTENYFSRIAKQVHQEEIHAEGIQK
jgi:hypothetical protein